ncbi:MAG: hypothetical protein ABWZ16_01575, partial [Microbacterium sp.]
KEITMSNIPGTARNEHTNTTTVRRVETKPAYKTTEFYAWIVVSLAILVASAMVDNGEDGQGFGADHAWQYVAFVTVAYILSRGIAKAGTRGRARDDRN